MTQWSWMKKVVSLGLIFLIFLISRTGLFESVSSVYELSLDLPDAWEYIGKEKNEVDRQDEEFPWLALRDAGREIRLQLAGSAFEYPLVLMVDKRWREHNALTTSFFQWQNGLRWDWLPQANGRADGSLPGRAG